MTKEIPNPDTPIDVYLVIKDEKIQLTPREIKHLRRAVSKYDWSHHAKANPESTLMEKLILMGFAGKSLNRISKIDDKGKLTENEECLICKSKKVTIHHVIPAASPESSNHKTNLIFLCKPCHIQLHKQIVQELCEEYERQNARKLLQPLSSKD